MDENLWSNDPDGRLVFRTCLKGNKLLYETVIAHNSEQNDCDT